MSKDSKTEQKKVKPDDTGTVKSSAHIKIRDITDGKNKVLVDKRG